jgi:hypothetical protein
MSPLPQRKKSADEIARLRESLGISGEAPPPPDFANEIPPPPPGKPPAQTAEPAPPTELPAPPPAAAAEEEALPAAPIRPVRSLRKSERAPAAPRPRPTASPAAPIPARRRSQDDLNEIRRREALALLNAPRPPVPLGAHPALITAGYLVALIGAFLAYRWLPFPWVAACQALALSTASFIFFKRTHSRHHAAFIAVLAIFILIFAALQYFPQLQYAP